MNKALKAALALIVGFTLVAVIVSNLPRDRYVVNRRQFEMIHSGMSRSDVESLLGGPPRNCLDNPAMVWLPQQDGKVVSTKTSFGAPTVRFFPNTSPEDGAQAVWLTDTGLIAACFGPDGRLLEKYFSRVHDMGGPRGIQRLWSRPAAARPVPRRAASGRKGNVQRTTD